MPQPPQDPPGPKNAFARKFLSRLALRPGEPDTACEAGKAGPWRWVPHPTLGHAIVHLAAHPSEPPVATFPNYFHALLALAVLPASGREPAWRLGKECRPQGHPVLVDGVFAGYFRDFDENLLNYLNGADLLTRSPWALSLLLQATGGPGLERTGQLLDRALRLEVAEGEDDEP